MWVEALTRYVLDDLSREVHDYFYDDFSQALCSRAWWKRNECPFWFCWTYIFGRKHCFKSYTHYHG